MSSAVCLNVTNFVWATAVPLLFVVTWEVRARDTRSVCITCMMVMQECVDLNFTRFCAMEYDIRKFASQLCNGGSSDWFL